jgi:uncharacterized protein (AIM24 family)
MSSTLKLMRKAPVMGVLHRGAFDVLANGKGVGSIELYGDTIEISVAPGRHTCKPAKAEIRTENARFR